MFVNMQLFRIGVLLFVLRRSEVLMSETGSSSKMKSEDILKYLVRYGYLKSKQPTTSFAAHSDSALTNSSSTNTTLKLHSDIGSYSDRDLKRALLDFQQYMSLPQTGVFDSETQQMMRLSRCGVPDKSPHVAWIPDGLPNEVHRRRRYALQGSSWQHQMVTYSLATPSPTLPTASQNQTVWSALRRWSEVSPLVFRWHPTAADITIGFYRGDHGDGQPFDGRGNVLGHAFYPSHGGNVHFDEDESWLIGTTSSPTAVGNSLLQVAIHEIGHALGIDHSSDKSAVMNAIYRTGNAVTYELADDDVAAIQSIYGMCETSFDAIFSWMGNGKTYSFKGDNYWSYNDAARRTDHGYPRDLPKSWQGVPTDVDEAFLWGKNWKTYFFKGSLFYKFNDVLDRVDDGYPQPIGNGWPGIPDNIDAAFTLSTSESFFFKGHLCYKFNNANNSVHTGYPKNITEVWPGIPTNLDTVFRYYWDAKTYFFKGLYYWKWDDTLNRAMGPLQIKYGWRNHCFV